jgi:5-methylcytosine-specific restriction protein A
MTTYLLTWNPNNWTWDDLPTVLLAMRQGRPSERRWSCGNTKGVPLGARVFLLRQGVAPKGIIASGWVTKATYEHHHWDSSRAASGDTANFVSFVFDALLDPTPGGDAPLDVRSFTSGPLATVNWSTPASGIRVSDPAAEQLEHAWQQHLPRIRLELGAADELPDTAVEGVVSVRLIKHRSRERALRAAKLAETAAKSVNGRLRCEVPDCGFDFEDRYGELGRGFAHVHHLRPLADAPGPTQTRLEDLAVVCANCHAMIHAGGETRALDDLVRAAPAEATTV